MGSEMRQEEGKCGRQRGNGQASGDGRAQGAGQTPGDGWGPENAGRTENVRGPENTGRTESVRGSERVGRTESVRGPENAGRTESAGGPESGGASENGRAAKGQSSESGRGGAAREWVKNLSSPDEKMVQGIKDILSEQEYQNINIVFANTIHDSSFFQRQGGMDEAPPQGTYHLTESGDFFRFFKEKKNSYLKLYVLVLIGLRIVEVSRLNELAKSLCEAFAWNADTFTEDEELPFSEVLDILGARPAVIEKNSRAGKIKLDAVGYSEETVRGLRMIFWRNYQNLRRPLIVWVRELFRTKNHPMAAMAGDGLAGFAEFDFPFLYENVISKMEQVKNAFQVNGLAKVLERAWKAEEYRDNIGILAGRWLRQKVGSAWRVSLIAYLRHTPAVKRQEVKTRLCEDLDGFLFDMDAAAFLVTNLHLYQELCEILYEILVDRFYAASDQREREERCIDFLYLLQMECILCGGDGNKVRLLDSLNQAKLRGYARGFLVWMWRCRGERRVLETILDEYFAAAPDSFDETYLRSFFQTLAFNGNKADYDNMEVYLERSVGRKTCAAKRELLGRLEEIRIQRRKKLEVQENGHV